MQSKFFFNSGTSGFSSIPRLKFETTPHSMGQMDRMRVGLGLLATVGSSQQLNMSKIHKEVYHV